MNGHPVYHTKEMICSRGWKHNSLYCTWKQNIVTKETYWWSSSNWKNAYKRPLNTDVDLREEKFEDTKG